MYRHAVRLINKCIGLNIPGYLENPATSRLWQTRGLRALASGGRDALVEAVAEGVAASLAPDLEAHPVHAAELADPAWHSSCQGKHVYVDVWHSSDPDRIGFSLWRGCDADDQFGWQEVPVDAAALQSTGWVTEAARVGRVIAAALAACGEHTC